MREDNKVSYQLLQLQTSVTRKRRANQTQSKQKKGNNKDQSEINETENRTIENAKESWFFESKKLRNLWANWEKSETTQIPSTEMRELTHYRFNRYKRRVQEYYE